MMRTAFCYSSLETGLFKDDVASSGYSSLETGLFKDDVTEENY